MLLVDCLGSSASKFLGLLQENKKLFLDFFSFFIVVVAFAWAFLKRLLITNIKYVFWLRALGMKVCSFVVGFTGNGVSSFNKNKNIRKQSLFLRKWWRKTFSPLLQISLKKLHKLHTWFFFTSSSYDPFFGCCCF